MEAPFWAKEVLHSKFLQAIDIGSLIQCTLVEHHSLD
jgi:hypothetical protein